MKLLELKAKCKELGVKSTGTKTLLEKRLRLANFLQNVTQNCHDSVKFRSKTPRQMVQVNSFQKRYSFLMENQKVIGKLDLFSNKTLPLTKSDVLLCKSMHLNYELPIMLEGSIQTHRIKEVIEEEDSDEDEI